MFCCIVPVSNDVEKCDMSNGGKCGVQKVIELQRITNQLSD